MATVISHEEKIYENFEEGVPIAGVIVGIKLLKNVPGFGGKMVNKLLVKILTDEMDSNNERMTALFSATASMHKDANLRRFIRQVMNGDVGESFDCELLINRQGNFVFENSTSEKTGKTYSNVTNVLKATKKVIVPADFVAFREDTDGSSVTKQANKPRPRQVATEVPDAADGNVQEI